MFEVTITWANGASVKNNPNVGGNALHVFPVGATFEASELVPDNTDPTNISKRWAKISGGIWNGKFVAVSYPSSSGNLLRATWEAVGEEVPPPSALKVIGAVWTPKLSDGSLGEPVEFIVKP